MNRTIKIDVQNVEMTLEAETQLVGDAFGGNETGRCKRRPFATCQRNEEETAQIENPEKVTPAESTSYRSLVMKLAYVAHEPHERATKWTHVRTQKVWSILGEEQETCVVVRVHDKRVAEDLLGRKGTTVAIVRRGTRLLRHMSCLQMLVALSSGEAEYCALIRGACTSLGIHVHYQD